MIMVLIFSIIWSLAIVLIVSLPSIMDNIHLNKINKESLKIANIIIEEYEKVYNDNMGEITLSKLNNEDYYISFSYQNDKFVNKLRSCNKEWKLYHYLEVILHRYGFSDICITNRYTKFCEPYVYIKFKI